MSLQLLSASLFPVSLAWFGGFWVCFLRFSPTVPPPQGCGLGPPSPWAVLSLEEDGGGGAAQIRAAWL